MLDFEEIKQVPILDVLRRYGVELRGRAGWMQGKCPLPSHDSKKTTSSFSVNVSKNFWQCFSDSCSKNRGGKKGGDVINLVAALENCSEYQAAERLASWFGVNGKKAPPAQAVPAVSPVRSAANPNGNGSGNDASDSGIPAENKVLQFAGFKELKHDHDYVANRGITKETASEFGVGFFAGRSSVIKEPYLIAIPVHNAKAKLVAYVGRSVDVNSPDKYHFPAGFHKSLELFGLHRIPDEETSVVLVEGFFSVLRLAQDGMPIPAVALMGCHLSETQQKLLERFERIVLLLDGDEAGQNATREMLPRLARQRWINAIQLPQGSQPDTLPTDELLGLFSAAHVF